MDDRVNGTAGRLYEEPPSAARRLNLTIRYLGLILPTALFFVGLAGSERRYGFLICFLLGAVVWATATAVLAVRHDWKGAAAISAVYVFLYAAVWLLIFGAIGRN